MMKISAATCVYMEVSGKETTYSNLKTNLTLVEKFNINIVLT